MQLACLPDTGVAVFEVSGTAHGAPAVGIAGDRSFLPLAMFEQQAAHGGGLALEVLPPSHFLLQEDTSEAADLLRTHLASR